MKKIHNFCLVLALAAFPLFGDAQWSGVRFDGSNSFKTIYAASANDAFVLGTDAMSSEDFMMRTSDGGGSWDSIVLNSPFIQYQLTELFFSDVTHGFTGGLVNASSQALMKSTDNATTWTDITPDPTSVNPVSALFFLDPSVGFAAADQDLYSTTDGGMNWATTSLSFFPLDLHFMNASVGFASGTYGTNVACVMKTSDGGANWTSSLDAVDSTFFVNYFELLNVVDENTLFTAMKSTNKLYRTEDGGATWNIIVCDSVAEILDFHFSDAMTGQVLSTVGQLFSTTDAGATWTLEYATDWGLYGPEIYLNSLSFSGGIGYVCGTNGLIKRYDSETSVNPGINLAAGSFTVFPNPSNGSQNLSIMREGNTGDFALTIITNLGQVVFSDQKVSVGNNQVVTLPVLNLAPGIYNVVLSGENEKQTVRIVIGN